MKMFLEELQTLFHELSSYFFNFIKFVTLDIEISRLLIEATLTFIKGIAIVSLLISAPLASMCLMAWLGPPAICPISSIGGGFLIGWKLGEKKEVKAKFC